MCLSCKAFQCGCELKTVSGSFTLCIAGHVIRGIGRVLSMTVPLAGSHVGLTAVYVAGKSLRAGLVPRAPINQEVAVSAERPGHV